jgi:hypothetical protein
MKVIFGFSYSCFARWRRSPGFEEQIMKPKTRALCNMVAVIEIAVVALGVAVAKADSLNVGDANHNTKHPTYVTLDPPGSVFTMAHAINPAGDIVGVYSDSSNGVHGFLRARDGIFTTFDAPGAVGTNAYSINPAGAIAGFYPDSSHVVHGFLRTPDGIFTTIDAPGAITAVPGPVAFGTFAFNINPAGAIAGEYEDNNIVNHGYVRAPDGTITTFDAPSAGTGRSQGTFTATTDGLNPKGAIAGVTIDDNGALNGFVRAPDGTIIEFEVPGAGTGRGQGTNAAGINPAGTIAGYHIDSSSVNHGYVRARDGTITTFDVPGAGTDAGQGTLPANINPAGNIAGNYIDARNVSHGFVRTAQGDITTFHVPDAGTDANQGTFPECNNPADAITGHYIDASGVFHGFLRTRK